MSADQIFNKRRIDRLPAHAALGLSVWLTGENQAASQAQILDFNSLSLRVRTPRPFRSCKVTHLEIRFGNKVVLAVKSPKLVRTENEDVVVFSLAPADRDERPADERTSPRIRIREELVPHAFCLDPLNPSRTLHFRVEDLSRGGMRLSTSLTNKHLLAGLKLTSLELLLPGVGVMRSDVVIRNVSLELAQKSRLRLHVSFQSLSKECLGLLSTFASMAGDGSDLTEIRGAGLRPKKIARGVIIEPIHSLEEYNEVLKVRYEAYLDAKKVKDHSTITDMGDSYDAHSLILAARCNSKIIGTTRIVYTRGAHEPLPCQAYFPKIELQKVPWERLGEPSRLAILPEYQGTDLVLNMFKTSFVYLVRMGITHPYVVASGPLVRMYETLGGIHIADGVPHPVLEDQMMSLMLLSTENYAKGKGMSAHCWELVARDAVDLFEPFDLLPGKPSRKMIELRKTMEALLIRFSSLPQSKRKKKPAQGNRAAKSFPVQRPKVVA